MGIGILAPVPAVHLTSAMETCAKVGRVAFGSGSWEVFAKANEVYGIGIPVLIYASHPEDDPDHLSTPGVVGFRGVYLGTTEARAGKHPNPDVRPLTTITSLSPDTAAAFFWEVGELVRIALSSQIKIGQLIAEGQKKPLTRPPRGPMLVTAMFL